MKNERTHPPAYVATDDSGGLLALPSFGHSKGSHQVRCAPECLHVNKFTANCGPLDAPPTAFRAQDPLHSHHRNATTAAFTPRNAPPVSASPLKSAVQFADDEGGGSDMKSPSLPTEQNQPVGLHVVRQISAARS